MSLKALLLQLLSAHADPLDVALLVRAGAVFGFAAGAVRVTLSRLQRDGHVESAGRGRWRLTAAAALLAHQVATWRDLPAQLRPWDGGWLGVATGGLPRTDRGASRRRDRALSLLGFRELRPGLELRPDNRVGGVEAARRRLVELGLEPTAPVFALGPLGPAQDEACGLWDAGAITRGYAAARAELARVRARVDRLPVEVAARECFVAGAAAIRVLAFDPLLPEPIVDAADRWALVDDMRAFDALGRTFWQRLAQSQEVTG